MSTSLIAPVVDHHPAPFRELSASSYEDHDVSIHRGPTERTRASVESGASVRSTTPPHRSAAANVIRVLGDRTESALRRELDRFFVARPGLSHADRAAIARAMARIRNQLLHHPRSTLRAAAATEPASAHHLIDAVGSIFKLRDTPPSSKSDRRRPTDRSADPVPKESTYEDF
jgi:Glutamyl-tRNAGlu reductase, dimerisation domain